MALPDDFAAESMYDAEQWFIHDLLEVDREGGRLVGSLDTTRIGPLVTAQRPWPGHERHLPGAVAVQMTATLGQLHAIYVLDLRATEGWVGFGTHIHKARFPQMGRIGPPVRAEVRSTRVRTIRGTVFVAYTFRFEQDGALVYEADHTAAWFRTTHRGRVPVPGLAT
jgi:hypothetical protein